MAKNTGDVDRTARLLLGGGLAIPISARGVVGTPAEVVGVIAIYLLATALLGWDPFWAVLRISTRSPNDVNPPPPKPPSTPPPATQV